MKAWKIVLIVIAVLGALAAAAFFWGKSVWDKIGFGIPRLTGLNFNGLTLTDLANIALTGQQKEATANVAMDVVNQNNFSIPFSSLRVKLFYNGQAIAETSDLLAQKQSVPANGTLTVNDTVKIYLNDAGVQFLLDKLKDGKATLDYKIMVKVFGIPLPKALQTYTLDV